jgi:hypothetical protein
MVNLLAAANVAAPIDTTLAPDQYSATFTNPAVGEYLYIIWDLRKATAIDLCFDASIANLYELCCDCTTAAGCTSFLMDSNNYTDATKSCTLGSPTDTFYHNGSGAYPEPGDTVYPNADCTFGYEGPGLNGWYKSDEGASGTTMFLNANVVILKQTC